MNLNEMFDAVIVLNLDRRPDRLESITNQLTKLNTTFYRWSAIDDLNTDMSPILCNLMNNHNRLHYAQWKGYKTVLFLDDDCEFVNDFYEKLEQVWYLIPDDWDMITFGDHLISSEQINDKIYRLYESYGGHAQAIRLKCASILFQAFQGQTFADVEFNKLKEKLNRYAISPGLVGQGRYKSDLVHDFRPNNLYKLWE